MHVGMSVSNFCQVLDGSTLILGIIYPEDAQSFYEAPRVIKGGQFDLQDSRSGSNGVRAPGSWPGTKKNSLTWKLHIVSVLARLQTVLNDRRA